MLKWLKNIFMANKNLTLKTPEQIEGIRKASALAAMTLDYIEQYVEEGVNTEFLDNKIAEFFKEHNATAATLGYKGYTKSSCISLNNVICHGIPAPDIILKKGDILNIDVTPVLDGYYGDTSRMYTVGDIDPEAARLIKITKECLDEGIKQAIPGNHLGNIGYYIDQYARKHGYSTVYEFCGHGVGVNFHEEPEVSHRAPKNSGMKLKPGMTFTIEPMINQGKARAVIDRKDGWTARTIDGKLSAQYEHTLLITESGNEVLTDIKGEYK